MSNYLRKCKIIISVILAILTAIMLPVEVFAQSNPKQKPSAKVHFDSLAESEDIGEIVMELKERRDEYTKHFRMDDGTIMAVVYDIPVHYKNKKGKWEDYDNTLISESTASPDEASQVSYSNKKGKLDIDFASETSDAALISLNSSKGNLSWEYIDAKKSNIKIDKSKKKLRGNDRFTSIERLSSKASYKSIYDKVNLDCIVSSVGVKENLILQDKSAQNEYEIIYDIKGLKAKQADKQTIKLYKNKKAVYTISAPCMYDSKRNFSEKLTLKILECKSDKLKVKLRADEDFLCNATYPVTVDPEVSLVGSYKTETAYVTDSEPDTVKHQYTSFAVGKSGSANLYGLVKCKNVSEDFSDKNIVSAKLNISSMTPNTEMEIDAYSITSSWTNDTATFNNVTYDSEVIDYASKTDNQNITTFDITKAFKKWANGVLDNNGIYLKSNDNFTNFGGYQCYFADRRPTYYVKYKEYTGLESDLTSHTVPCGRDAVLSVCDYTGSLSVRQNFFEENTARLPLSIYATYHSSRNTINEQTGYGWHYSFNQTVSEDDNYYKYIDEDGVDHYFKKEMENGSLSDEEDSGLSLTKDNNKIKIDNDSITKSFEIVDNSDVYKLKNDKSNENENNSISYTYNSAGYVTKITSSLGEYNIHRNNNYYITDIQTPNNKQMNFVYCDGVDKIKKFTAADGKTTKFEYTNTSENGMINEVRYCNENGSTTTGGGVICNYNSDKKVSSITELGKNGASRKVLSITYNDDNTTEFKELENNNKKETYTFDNYGKTVSVLNANGMITSYGNSGSLSVNTGADSYTKNYLCDSNEPNSCSSEAGTIDGVRSEKGTVTIDDTVAYLGHKSIKVNNTGDSQFFTVAKFQKPMEDLAGKKVTLSAYVKLENVEKGNRDNQGGAILRLEAYKQYGPKELDIISPAIVENIGGMEWQRISVTAEIPQVCEHYYYEVSFGLRNAKGTAWFDCIQLEKGKTANDYNALSNSDFSTTDNWKTEDDNSISINNNKVEISGNGGEPASTEEINATEEPTSASEEATSATYIRTLTETVANDVIEETNSYGSITKTEQGFVTRTYKRTYESVQGVNSSEPEEASNDEGEETQTVSCNKYIYQEVDINKSNVSFVLSGSAKAKSVPLNSEYRTFGIALKVKYDGDSSYSENHYQEFNAYTDSMQHISLSVSPNDSEKTVEKVAFAFVYGYNKNKMEVKNAMLNYVYNGTDEESSTEPETSEPTSTEPEATEPDNSNEDEDNLIDEEVQSESINTNEEYMRSQTTYDSNGNYVTSEVDESGNATNYTNDADGNVTAITDAKGNSTAYSYDAHDNLLSVSQGDSSNTYTYNAYNELSKITHNDFEYNYTYNNFGEPTSVKVGSQALITYEYDSNGNVTKAIYGNGDYLDYTYDDYARITKVKLNDTTTLATYIYNKKNKLIKFVDGKSGETTEYCYDCNGNLLYKYLISDDGELLRVVEGDTEKTTVNGSMRKITSGTDDNGKTYVKNGKATITTDTDDFGRTTKVATKVDDSPKFSVNYTYKNVLDSDNNPTHRTTKNIDKMSYKLGNDEPLVNYSYTYDKNGNIKNIRENGISKYVYTYDSLNQLTRVADASQYYLFDYTYDTAGNITEKKSIKSNPDGAHLNTTTTNYLYTNSNWGDLLTKYDGQTLTYDNIGNPLNYRDGMSMTWSGRELQSISKNNNTYSFTYNLDGLRTKRTKEQNNTVLETVNYYYDDSNNLIGLKKGTTTVLFYYDSEGQLYSMTKGDDTYFFIKNLQGDVTKIIDENGTVCATYAYDAWGALLAENEDSSITGLNPFRYRGYVYDPETELYYLQSRYYDPLTGRFLNADSYTDTKSGSPLSTNMFAYCENNPISGYDPDGFYSRSKALKYAKKWWNKRNSKYYSYGNDCANFVSQCLFAGKLCNMYGTGNSGWHSYYKGNWLWIPIFDVSESWRSANKLRFWIINSMHYCQHLFTSMNQIKKAINSINPGAVAFMSTDYNGKLSHAVLIGRVTKNNIYFYAHTNNRDARKNDYGFAEYFKDKPKNKTALIAIIYL
jgi:RHS repeat-associated protein